jgi:hypothetical protein
MIIYVIMLFIFLAIFILVSHNINNKRINTNLEIQQTEQPNNKMITLLQNKKLPSIYLYELEIWDGFDLLIGEDYNIIKEVLDNKEALSKLNYYLKPFELSFTTKWDITFHKNNTNWEHLPSNPIKEIYYNHLIVNFSGLMMVCLFNPNMANIKVIENSENNNSEIKENVKDILADENKIKSTKLEYIIVTVRPSNMIYIPFGWYYWIYNGINDKYCCYLNCVNHSLV